MPAWLPAVLWKKTVDKDRSLKRLPFYGGAAVFALIGQLCTFIALNGGQISGSRRSSIPPVIRHSFHRAVLARRRKITAMVLIGVVLLVAGIGFITVR